MYKGAILIAVVLFLAAAAVHGLKRQSLDGDDRLSPCRETPCQNGGFCVVRKQIDHPKMAGQYTETITRVKKCYCPKGWSGDLCEIDDYGPCAYKPMAQPNGAWSEHYPMQYIDQAPFPVDNNYFYYEELDLSVHRCTITESWTEYTKGIFRIHLVNSTGDVCGILSMDKRLMGRDDTVENGVITMFIEDVNYALMTLSRREGGCLQLVPVQLQPVRGYGGSQKRAGVLAPCDKLSLCRPG